MEEKEIIQPVDEIKAEEAASIESDAPEKKKSRKVPVIIAAVAALVIAAAAFIFIGSGETAQLTNRAQPEADVITALSDMDGNAYLPLYDGSVVEIKDEVEIAGITCDRQHMIVRLYDGTLYVTDIQQTEKKIISENCAYIEDVRNSGLVYVDEDDNMYRVLFSDYSELKLGEDMVAALAENSMSLICADGEGHIYSLAETETELVKRGSYTESVVVNAISDDGQFCMWTNIKGNECTIYVSDGDERSKLGTCEAMSKYYSGIVESFSADQQMLVVGSLNFDGLWIKQRGQEPVKAKLGDNLAFSTIYTDKGLLEDVNAADIESLYVQVESDKLQNLYNVTLEGDRERVLSKVWTRDIDNGKLIYQNEDGLYYAELKGTELGEETKITSEAGTVSISDDGQYVFYFKNVEDNEGTLYCYKLGAEEPVKVAGTVSSQSNSIYRGADGKSLLFFKDVEEIEDSGSYMGTLYSWSYGDDEATKIASEVLRLYVDSAYKDGLVDVSNFTYMKFTENVDGDSFGNLMQYDGKESTRLASDVSYEYYYDDSDLLAPATEAPAR